MRPQWPQDRAWAHDQPQTKPADQDRRAQQECRQIRLPHPYHTGGLAEELLQLLYQGYSKIP